MTSPEGALPEKEREALVTKYRDVVTHAPPGYFAVERDGTLHVNGHFSFQWEPKEAYYFTNYWLAWAYWTRLCQKRKITGSVEYRDN